MQIEILKELKNTFLINNELSVPKDSSNTDYQAIQKYIANGGIYQAYDNLAEAKEVKKQILKVNRDKALSSSLYSIKIDNNDCSFYLKNSDLAVIQARINSLTNDTSTKSWSNTEGKRVLMNKAAFLSLLRHISSNDETVWDLYAEKVQEIEDAQTLEELENININLI